MTTPSTMASAIDKQDNAIVTDEARSSDGRYRRAASHLDTDTTLADVSSPITGATGCPARICAYSFGWSSFHTRHFLKTRSSVPSRIAPRSNSSMLSRSGAFSDASTPT